MRTIVFLIAAASLLNAQSPVETADLLRLTNRIQEALDAGDLRQASELSAALKQALKESRNRALAPKADEQIDTALGWLPYDTETVIVAREPFTLDFRTGRGNAPPGVLRALQGYTLLPLSAKSLDDVGAKLEGQTVRTAVFASRRFQNREPVSGNTPQPGLIAWQGCGIYTLAVPRVSAAAARPPDESVLGYPVWEARAPGEETFFAAQPKPDLVLACNERGFLTEVLSRIGAPSRVHAFPLDSPLLRMVDRAAPVWALRRFLAERAAVDPSQPATGGLLGVADLAATGMLLEVGGLKGVLHALWLSPSGANPWRSLAGVTDPRAAGRVQRGPQSARNGIWELTLEQDDASSLFTAFSLMGMLGFMAAL